MTTVYAIVSHADVCSDVPCGFAVVVGGRVFALFSLSLFQLTQLSPCQKYHSCCLEWGLLYAHERNSHLYMYR